MTTANSNTAVAVVSNPQWDKMLPVSRPILGKTGKQLGIVQDFTCNKSAKSIKEALKLQNPALKGKALAEKVNEVLTGEVEIRQQLGSAWLQGAYQLGWVPDIGVLRKNRGGLNLVKVAESVEKAREILADKFDCADTNAGAWDNGDPILFEASLIGTPELYEADGVLVVDDAKPEPPKALTPDEMVAKFPKLVDAETCGEDSHRRDLICPNCGDRIELVVFGTVGGCILDDGIDYFDYEGDFEYGTDNTCKCDECGHRDKFGAFRCEGLDDHINWLNTVVKGDK